jgi:hypothetical protein
VSCETHTVETLLQKRNNRGLARCPVNQPRVDAVDADEFTQQVDGSISDFGVRFAACHVSDGA